MMNTAKSVADIYYHCNGIDKRELRTAIKRIIKHKKKTLSPELRSLRKGSIKAAQIVEEKANMMSLSPRIVREAMKIAEAATRCGCLEGKKPSTIAGASLLIALEDEKGNMKVIVKDELLEGAFGITKATISQRAKTIREVKLVA